MGKMFGNRTPGPRYPGGDVLVPEQGLEVWLNDQRVENVVRAKRLNIIAASTILAAVSYNREIDAINLNLTSVAQAAVNATGGAIGCTWDGGGSVIAAGTMGRIRVPFACTIQNVTLLANQVGSAVVDIWKDTYANYPPTAADSITASAKPTLSSAQKYEDTILTGWTKNVQAGDVMIFHIDSASIITQLVLVLGVEKTVT